MNAQLTALIASSMALASMGAQAEVVAPEAAVTPGSSSVMAQGQTKQITPDMIDEVKPTPVFGPVVFAMCDMA